MSYPKLVVVAAALAVATLASSAVAATKAERERAWEQGWKFGDEVRGQNDNKYGPKCQFSLTSRGQGNVGLGITQVWAKLRTRRHWEDAATKLYGAQYAKWSKARGKSITCERADRLLLCKATANPCR